MKSIALLLLLCVLGVPAALGQATPADTQTLQAILVELRAIHNEVRLSETTQILLTELEVQRSTVRDATQRRDELRNRLTGLQANIANITAQLAHWEDSSGTSLDAAQKRQIADQQEQFKSALVSMKPQEQEASSDLQTADTQLRKEQLTLDSIQAQLDSAVKRLQPAR